MELPKLWPVGIRMGCFNSIQASLVGPFQKDLGVSLDQGQCKMFDWKSRFHFSKASLKLKIKKLRWKETFGMDRYVYDTDCGHGFKRAYLSPNLYQVVYIKYGWLFVCQSYLSKLVFKQRESPVNLILAFGTRQSSISILVRVLTSYMIKDKLFNFHEPQFPLLLNGPLIPTLLDCRENK